MALIEGGAFRCYIHNFETESIDKWNKHCTTEEGHTETGNTLCITCGQRIHFTDLPFHPLDVRGSKNIQLRCEECDQKTTGKVKRSTQKTK